MICSYTTGHTYCVQRCAEGTTAVSQRTDVGGQRLFGERPPEISGENSGGAGGGGVVRGESSPLGRRSPRRMPNAPWREEGEFAPPDRASSRTPRTRTRSRRGSPPGRRAPERRPGPCPARRSSTADTSWCRRPTATRCRAGGKAAGLCDTTLTR